jgi:hypothetical protein
MRSILVAAALTFVAAAAAAHHSPAAFDRTTQKQITGVIKAFKWQNPHSWMEVDVPKEGGGTETWGIEMTSPTYLIRAGWTSKTIRPGDKVTVTFYPVRTGEPAGMFVNVTFEDGRVLSERPARLGGQ